MSDENKLVMSQLSSTVDKLDAKQDKMLDIMMDQNSILAAMQVTQQQHHESLEEHHKRTTLNEDRLELLENERHEFRNFVKGAIWAFGIALTIAGLLAKLL
jgi:hypothetical protein